MDRYGGFDALYPKPRTDRGQPRRLPPEVAAHLVELKANNPAWSVRRLADNASLAIDDFEQAQAIARDFDVRVLHRHLEHWAQRFCPAGHHWSIMQAEYATDILFHRQDRFQPLYDAITRTAVHSIKADQVATFLGRKLTKAYAGEAGNDFSTRIHGTRIRHCMGPASINLYEKFGIIARVECTTNDPSFFKLHRDVKQRDGTSAFKLAPLRKSIHSLRHLATCMANANPRYLAFLAAIDNPWTSWKDIDRIGRATRDNRRSLRGFNLMTDSDLKLFLVLARPDGPSAACAPPACDSICPTAPQRKSPVCSNASAPMASSRRSDEHTSTTLPNSGSTPSSPSSTSAKPSS